MNAVHSSIAKHSIIEPYIFVLWAEKFIESIATTFILKLRQKGLRVKVVGLSGRYSKGVCGLTLGVDLTLGEALPIASRANYVIVPCDGVMLHHTEGDPRFREFIHQASTNHAQVVVAQMPLSDLQRADIFTLAQGNVVSCAEAEDVDLFINELVQKT